MISLNSNIGSLRNLRDMYSINLDLSDSIEKLSSGKRINNGADDPSGLAMSKGMTAKFRGLDVATQNTQDGLKWLEARDRAMSEQYDIIMRMRDLALRASNEAVLTTDDQAKLNDEAQELMEELTRIGRANNINGKDTLFNPGQLDVIWVLDQTGSMGGYIAAISAAASQMYSDFASQGFDLRMGAVGFEAALSGTGTRSFKDTAADFVADVNAIGGALFGAVENGINAVSDALDLATLGGDFRPDAQKVVVLITDEDADDFGDPVVSDQLSAQPGAAAGRNALRDKLSAMGVTMYMAGEVKFFPNPAPPPALITLPTPDQDYSSIATDPLVGGQAYYLDAGNAWVSSITNALLASGGPWNDRFYVGDNADSELFRLEYRFETLTAEAQKLSVDLTTTSGARNSVDAIDSFLETLGTARADTANIERQFSHIIDELQNQYINLRAANSKIEDTNMAAEMTRFTKTQLMQQSSLAAATYANAMPGTVLDLIGRQGIGRGG